MIGSSNVSALCQNTTVGSLLTWPKTSELEQQLAGYVDIEWERRREVQGLQTLGFNVKKAAFNEAMEREGLK